MMWMSVLIIPRGRRVMVLSVRGIVARATCPDYAVIRRGKILCKSAEHNGGDLSVVGWREMTEAEKARPARNAVRKIAP